MIVMISGKLKQIDGLLYTINERKNPYIDLNSVCLTTPR